MRYVDIAVIVVYLIGITWSVSPVQREADEPEELLSGGQEHAVVGDWILDRIGGDVHVDGDRDAGAGVDGNFGFLQVVFGYLLARIVITFLFLPHYFKGELYTAYELMQRRFGLKLRRLTAGTFLLLRALAEGVRVFAISIVISIVLGTGEIASIVVIVCLTLFYTFEGGMTAVIWTDVVQMFLYVGGAIVSLFVILNQIPGGWAEVAQKAGDAAKFQVFDFRLEWTMEFFSRQYSFWAGVLGGCFLTTASHGTEQLMVQRLLSAKTEGEARKALFASWFVILFQFTLFLTIGVILWVYYGNSGLQPPKPADRLIRSSIWNSLPVGVAGLVIAAILAAAMSNLSAALNSLASTTIMDFYKLGYPDREESHYLRLAKRSTLLWG